MQVLSELASGGPSNGPSSTKSDTYQPSTRPTQDHIHHLPVLDQEGAKNFYLPASFSHKPTGTSNRVGNMASTHSNPASVTTTSWTTTSSFSAPVQMSHEASQNAFYRSCPQTVGDSTQTSYGDMYSSATTVEASQSSQPASYGDMSTVDMSLLSPMGMGAERGNLNDVMLLGNIMDEGFLAFPFSFDGNFQF